VRSWIVVPAFLYCSGFFVNKNITCASCLGCSVLAGIICVFIFGAGIVGVGIVAEQAANQTAKQENQLTPPVEFESPASPDRDLSSKKVSAWVAVQQFVKKKIGIHLRSDR